jgi:signal transduction histidine kinase
MSSTYQSSKAALSFAAVDAFASARGGTRTAQIGPQPGRALDRPGPPDGYGKALPPAAAMYRFLQDHREALIARCKGTVAQRPRRAATDDELRNGIPLFLEQLARTLRAEEAGEASESFRISGASGGNSSAVSEIGVSATAHGRQLLELGYTVDQVVHDYGDICQAVTGLAAERKVPFTIDEFRTLNRCLDNAIADAVTAFSAGHDIGLARNQSAQANERVGSMVHELRNSVHTATLAVRALESGSLPLQGATGGVLKRSLEAMTSILAGAVASVRAEANHGIEVFSLAPFIADAAAAASLDTGGRGCLLTVDAVDDRLAVRGARELLLAALVNLLQNAFKFSRPDTVVNLAVRAGPAKQVLIEVADHCGGLPEGSAEKMFRPFMQQGPDKSGLGLGLSIARNSIEADGGTLGVRDVPGTGCVFAISLPIYAVVPGG